jgi:hypothetical protein
VKTLRRVGRPLLVVLFPWVSARIIVLSALGLARFVVSRTHITDPAVVSRVHAGLLGWDAGWYENIARVGYRPLGHDALRFFPLVPLIVRALSWLGINDGAGLIIVANASALIGTALLYVLVRRETGDERIAMRAVWLLSLIPAAFTLVMGYAEATLLVFTVGAFLALRPGAARQPVWWAAALCGFLAALTRPIGLAVLLAVAVELARHWRHSPARQRVGGVVALLAPLAGLATYLGWAQDAFANAWLPLQVQGQAKHHGGLADPFVTLWHDARGLRHHIGTALHVPWVILAVVVLVICWRRLPGSYALFATGILAVALSGTNLDSFERYALSAFPLAMTGALLLDSTRIERLVLTLSAAALFGYALLAFFNLSVP